jgi:hypothetical protein
MTDDLSRQVAELMRWAYRDAAMEPQRRSRSWSRFSVPEGNRRSRQLATQQNRQMKADH